MEQSKIFEKAVLKSEKGLNINFIRLKPGQIIQKHKHKLEKYDYIMEGSFSDETGIYKKGDLLENKKGSEHEVKAGKEGCEFLVIFSKE